MTAPAKHVWIALVVVYIVWGSTYFGIKIAVETMPPLLAAGSRFLTAALLLAGILAWRGTSLRVSRRELGASAIAGGFLLLPPIPKPKIVCRLRSIVSHSYEDPLVSSTQIHSRCIECESIYSAEREV